MRVTHICGRRERRLRLLCERFDVPRYSTNWASLLDDEALDAVIVALPHPLHAEAGLAVLERGLHLFMQKPLCTTVAEANQLVAASEARPAQVVYCRPSFDGYVYEMRRQLAAGAIGKVSGALARHSHGGPEIYYAEVADAFEEERLENDLWFFDAETAGGGALIDMGVYSIANLVALLGKVDHVTARMATVDEANGVGRHGDADSGILQWRAGDSGDGLVRSGALFVPARTWHGRQARFARRCDRLRRPSSYEREWAEPLVDEISADASPQPA